MSRDMIRRKIDAIAHRAQTDAAFRSRLNADPEATFMAEGLGEEAALVLAEDWRGANAADVEGYRMCDPSCRFHTSDKCGPTSTTLRHCN